MKVRLSHQPCDVSAGIIFMTWSTEVALKGLLECCRARRGLVNLARVGGPTVLYVFQGAMPDILATLSQILMTEQEQPKHRNHIHAMSSVEYHFPLVSLPA